MPGLLRVWTLTWSYLSSASSGAAGALGSCFGWRNSWTSFVIKPTHMGVAFLPSLMSSWSCQSTLQALLSHWPCCSTAIRSKRYYNQIGLGPRLVASWKKWNARSVAFGGAVVQAGNRVVWKRGYTQPAQFCGGTWASQTSECSPRNMHPGKQHHTGML